ncbi:MAG TPA: choice-of-anchor D domain-containing protein, partial [Nocardioides sp.]|nr:choice-of-anchor D domain-containing protein [Nocardioides sp.]
LRGRDGVESSLRLEARGQLGPAPKPAALSSALTSYQFPQTTVGQVKQRPLVFSNSGDLPTPAPTVTLTDPDASYAVDTGCRTAVPAHGNCTIMVDFAPTARGRHSGVLTVAAGPAGTATVNLTGFAQAPVQLTITPSDQTFPPTAVGSESAAVIFTVQNTGDLGTGDLEVSLDPGWRLVSNECGGVALSGGASCDLGVAFAPTGVGDHSGSVTVIDRGSGNSRASAALSGTGTPAPPLTWSINPVTFDPTPVDSLVTSAAIKVTNSSQSSIDLPRVRFAITDEDSDPSTSFGAVMGSCPAALELIPGGSCTVNVFFQPVRSGTVTGQISLLAPNGTVLTEPLRVSGTGS